MVKFVTWDTIKHSKGYYTNMAKSDLDTSAAKRLHKATYARDKKKGGYLIRVAGPYANKFAGRDVPVGTITGEEHSEKLLRLIWNGVNDGEYGGVVGEPVALYSFESKPREPEDEVDF